MNTWKSIGAIGAGFVLVFFLSIATDIVLYATGLMQQPFERNSTSFILVVIAYRTFYGILGSYLTASLAADRPMFHAMIGGWIGLALSIVGAIVMRDKGPGWYALSLIGLALPTAWIGGLWQQKRIHRQKQTLQS